MFFWYVNNQPLNEFHGGNAFGNRVIVFMPGVVESNKVSIIFVDTGSSNYRPSEISCDVFDCGLGSTIIGLCPNIESFLMILINMVLDFAKGRVQSFGK